MAPSIGKYINIPWARDGHSFEGASCWGLVRLFYRHEFHLDLADLSDDRHIPDVWFTVAPNQVPALGDVALFRLPSYGRHVGIVLNKRDMLHVSQLNAACIESFRGLKWKRRLLNIYRHVMQSESPP